MRRRMLAILCCPSCGGELGSDLQDEEIISGRLVCASCAAAYPVTGGIPRFLVQESNADSFGLQWNRFRTEQLDRYSGLHESERRFHNETGWTPEWLQGRKVLEVGCGAGRFLEIASRDAELVVGIDASDAVDAARRSLHDRLNVELVQASIYDLPIRPGSFDACYCIGVAQHTPDPPRAIEALGTPVREGGAIALTCYERRPWTALNAKYLIRPLTRRIPATSLLRLLELAMPVLFPLTDVAFRIPVVGALFRFVIPVANYVGQIGLSRPQRRRWALLDTFDMLAPKHDHPQTLTEVVTALRRAGVVGLRRLANPGINVIGTKGP